MGLGDRTPVVDAGTAERVGPDADLLGLDGVDVDDVRQVLDVGVHVVVPLGGLQRPRQRDPLHVGQAAAQNLVGALGDHARGVGVRRSAVGRVVLEPAVSGRVVRRGDDDPVGERTVAPAVELQDRVADGRGRGETVGAVDHRHHVVGGQHLQRRDPGGLGQRVGVAPDEQRSRRPLCGAVFHDGLRRSQDVCLVERGIEAGPAVSRGPERDLLIDVLRVGHQAVVSGDHLGHVDEIFGQRRLSGTGVGSHGHDSALSRGPARPRRQEFV